MPRPLTAAIAGNDASAAAPPNRAPWEVDAGRMPCSSLRQKYPEVMPEFLAPPIDDNPSWSITTRGGSERERTKYIARSDTGEVVGPVDSDLGQFIRNIHVFSMFGPRWPVGFSRRARALLTRLGVS